MSPFKTIPIYLIILILLSQTIVHNAETFNGNTFPGDSDGKYQDDILQCNDNEDCTITCSNYPNSCKNANIQCPTNGNCAIICNSGTSGFTANDVCQGITVQCPTNGDCNISCNDNTACESANINGKTSNIFTMSCDGGTTCQNAIIDGRDTNDFTLTCGTSGTNTCTSLTIYFPENINGQKRATVSAGDDSFSAGTGNPMQFYAIYGWQDVSIIDYGGTYNENYHRGTMHCQDGYGTSCDFKSDGWECANTNDICNNPPTPPPTDSPTEDPTLDPTSDPTKYPTKYPTNYPTSNPTSDPTSDPTTDPTKVPTKGPTTYPTIGPTVNSMTTLNPTERPSHSPTNNGQSGNVGDDGNNNDNDDGDGDDNDNDGDGVKVNDDDTDNYKAAILWGGIGLGTFGGCIIIFVLYCVIVEKVKKEKIEDFKRVEMVDHTVPGDDYRTTTDVPAPKYTMEYMENNQIYGERINHNIPEQQYADDDAKNQRRLYYQAQFMQMMMVDPRQQTYLMNMDIIQRKQYIEHECQLYIQRIEALHNQKTLPLLKEDNNNSNNNITQQGIYPEGDEDTQSDDGSNDDDDSSSSDGTGSDESSTNEHNLKDVENQYQN